MANAHAVRTDCGTPNTTNQKRLWIVYWSGVNIDDGMIRRPTMASAFAGSFRYALSK